MSKNTRQNIRKEMKAVLANLDKRWLKAASSNLCLNLNKLLHSELSPDLQHLLAWSSFFAGEPDLSTFIGRQLDSKTVYLPRVLPDGLMDFISIGKDWGEQASTGAFGIPEPAFETGTPYNSLLKNQTVIIVPGLAFDPIGNRLGRGKGYYDRFLGHNGLRDVVKIGVGWSLQKVESIPVYDHDIPVDWFCHEEGFSRCGI